MADSPAFEAACASLEAASSLDRLEARGTVRLVLKEAGLEARSVTASDLVVVVERLLPKQLEARGVDEPEALCGRIVQGLANVSDAAAGSNTPEAVFSRLGGS